MEFFFVTLNQVLNLIQDLPISGSGSSTILWRCWNEFSTRFSMTRRTIIDFFSILPGIGGWKTLTKNLIPM